MIAILKAKGVELRVGDGFVMRDSFGKEIKEPTNPLVGFGIISKQQWDEAQSEIGRLKAELELRTKERDQATLHMEIADNEVHILKEFVGYAQIGSKTTTPELFAHLAGRGGGSDV